VVGAVVNESTNSQQVGWGGEHLRWWTAAGGDAWAGGKMRGRQRQQTARRVAAAGRDKRWRQTDRQQWQQRWAEKGWRASERTTIGGQKERGGAAADEVARVACPACRSNRCPPPPPPPPVQLLPVHTESTPWEA